jgi:hypothetical protein
MPGTDYPKILKDAIKSTFFEAYNNEPDGIYPELVTVVESGRGRMSETYGFLGNNPAVREWLDERTSGRPDEYEYVIKNRKWESTLEIKREDVDADQYGQIRLRVQQLAWAARRPTMSALGRPGPCVAATADRLGGVTPASARACRTRGSQLRRCSRVANSGTTPPYSA